MERSDLFNSLDSISEDGDKFVFFIEIEHFVPNRVHGDKEIPHPEISETNMNDLGRRLVKDDTIGKVAVFGNNC